MTQLTIESYSGNFAQNMTILLIVIVLIIVGIISIKVQHNKLFEKWFKEVLDKAHSHGCTMEEIQKFEEVFWFDYYCLDMTADQAIEQYKKDN